MIRHVFRFIFANLLESEDFVLRYADTFLSKTTKLNLLFSLHEEVCIDDLNIIYNLLLFLSLSFFFSLSLSPLLSLSRYLSLYLTLSLSLSLSLYLYLFLNLYSG